MKVLFRLFLLGLFIGVVGLFLLNNPTMLQQKTGVQGVQTKNTEEIQKNITNTVNKEINAMASKAGEIKISDIASAAARLPQVPQDVNGIKAYVQEQFEKATGKKK